jgi:hypothetical protein
MDCNASTVAVALQATRTRPRDRELFLCTGAKRFFHLRNIKTCPGPGRFGEGRRNMQRGACAPRKFRVATFIFSVFHHPHETLFDCTHFRRVIRYDGAGRDKF